MENNRAQDDATYNGNLSNDGEPEVYPGKASGQATSLSTKKSGQPVSVATKESGSAK
ncbi:MAG: hypothetical protein J1F43_02545 [Muribaculaceae bacterium]|nr:hypothetical protein [Muribaculaceae bacterium]